MNIFLLGEHQVTSTFSINGGPRFRIGWLALQCVFGADADKVYRRTVEAANDAGKVTPDGGRAA